MTDTFSSSKSIISVAERVARTPDFKYSFFMYKCRIGDPVYTCSSDVLKVSSDLKKPEDQWSVSLT